MTGQGAAQVTRDDLSVAVELRTVNNRYYKLALRASDGYSPLEPRIDEVVRRVVRRGTVQLDLRIDRQRSPDDYLLNETALVAYSRQLAELAARLKVPADVPLAALLPLPGIVNEQAARPVDTERDWPAIEAALLQALEGLTTMRSGEGRKMAADMAANCHVVAAGLDAIQARAPQVADGYRQRLTERLNKLLQEYGVSVEPTDVIREVGLFSERTDISEEVVRLRSHVEQFHEIMALDESSGRKLEFLTQEMFRETNTIGSKANDAEIARHVIDIKTAIERIREMIQNVE